MLDHDQVALSHLYRLPNMSPTCQHPAIYHIARDYRQYLQTEATEPKVKILGPRDIFSYDDLITLKPAHDR